MFTELNDLFAWAEAMKLDIVNIGGSLERRDVTWQQFRSCLAKRF